MRKKLVVVCVGLMVYGVGMAIPDSTPFYRATLAQGTPTRSVQDWASQLDARISSGSTYKAWDHDERKVDLFHAHGNFAMKYLGENMEGLSSGGSKSTTYAQLREVGHDSSSDAGGSITQLYSGDVRFKGHFRMRELDLCYKQNIKYGFYIQAYAPLREAKINAIDYVNTLTSSSENATLDTFLDDTLDTVLSENGLNPIKSNWGKSGISDVIVSAGWHGMEENVGWILDSFRGFFQIGAIIPCASRRSLDYVFEVPLGHNGHWGVNMHAQAQAVLWKWFAVGVTTDASVFLSKKYMRRMQTSINQNGWIQLEKGLASVNPGNVWNLGAYLGVDRVFGGFSAYAGYTYAKEEKTTLEVHDTAFLATAAAADQYFSKNQQVNADERLEGWYQHQLVLQAEYDFAAHSTKFAPRLNLFYTLPIRGEYAFVTSVIGGTLGLQIGWSF